MKGGKLKQKPSDRSDKEEQRVAYLDQSLWAQLEGDADIQIFGAAWLALQCQVIQGVSRGVLVLDTSDQDLPSFEPVAYWPKGRGASLGLTKAAETAMAESRGVALARKHKNSENSPAKKLMCDVAFPFQLSDKLLGVVALEVEGRPREQLSAVLRQLQWGSSWIQSFYKKHQSFHQDTIYQRTAQILDLMAAVVETHDFENAAATLVTNLATKFNCDRVSLGLTRGKKTKVKSLSHSAHFDKRMNLLTDLGKVMDEATDQWTAIVYPLPEMHICADTAHRHLAKEHGSGAILTVPLITGNKAWGALTLERSAVDPFMENELEVIKLIADMSVPILRDKRDNEQGLTVRSGSAIKRQLVRLLGPDYWVRKLVVSAMVALTVFFTMAKGDYRVTADTRIEGVVRRAVIAPFAGYVASANFRAGEKVTKGDVLARLEDEELKLERLRLVSERHQRILEYDKALAESDRANLIIIKAQIDQADAQISLNTTQLERAIITTPFDGIIVTGDLSQSIGGSVERGDLLFEITPLNKYRVFVKVDEREIADIQPGQVGEMALSSIPEQKLHLLVEQVTPVSEAREGRNTFQVEARLTGDIPLDRLRPGMEGVAKINIDNRRLIWIWTYKMVDWFRITFWRWLP